MEQAADRRQYLLALTARYPQIRRMAERGEISSLNARLPCVQFNQTDLALLAALTDAEIMAFRTSLEAQFASIVPHGI